MSEMQSSKPQCLHDWKPAPPSRDGYAFQQCAKCGAPREQPSSKELCKHNLDIEMCIRCLRAERTQLRMAERLNVETVANQTQRLAEYERLVIDGKGIHVASGIAGPDAKQFSARDIEAMTAVALALRDRHARASAPPTASLPDAILNVAELLHTQDNRITRDPIFVVEMKKRVYGIDPQWGGDVVWLNDGDEVTDPEEIKELDAHWDETGEEKSDYTRTAYVDDWEFVTACFTQSGCESYLRRNGHNHRGETRIYAHGSYRNAEWEAVRNYLMSLRASPTKAASPRLHSEAECIEIAAIAKQQRADEKEPTGNWPREVFTPLPPDEAKLLRDYGVDDSGDPDETNEPLCNCPTTECLMQEGRRCKDDL